jgi:hypothetical protein
VNLPSTGRAEVLARPVASDVQEVLIEPGQHRSVSLSHQPAAAVKVEGRN